MKPARLVVGLTGGIGSGKSTALAEFKRGGAETIDLDEIAREQAKPGRAAYKAIVKDFGSCVLRADGAIDRALLGRVVFGDVRARKGLEGITHPLILKEMDQRIRAARGVVVVDVPLLFEKKLERRFDVTVCVAANDTKRLQRIMKRDGMSPAEARRRLKAQLPMKDKRNMSDVTISNDKTISALKASVRSYHAGLKLLHEGL